MISVENPLDVDEHTLFQIGSTGKTFIATMIMRLVEQEELSLEDPVRRYLPDFATLKCRKGSPSSNS